MLKLATQSLGTVTFRPFTEEEVMKLSVLDITTSQNFNALGHAVTGGVYDLVLGATERNELCKTCGQTFSNCDGHFAHISLPLPVYNPLFTNILRQLLHISCLECYHLLLPTNYTILLKAQLTALEYGLVELVEDLYDSISSNLEKHGEKISIENAKKINIILNEGLSTITDLEKAKKDAELKNICKYRQQLIQEFTITRFQKLKKPCRLCNAPKRKVAYVNGNKFAIDSGKKRKANSKNKKSKKKKKNDGSEDNDIEEDDDIEMEDEGGDDVGGNDNFPSFLMPKDVKKIIVALWENEKEFLKMLYPVLDSAKCATDLFFLDVILIPATKYRPVNHVGSQKYENPQSITYTRVYEMSFVIGILLKLVKGETNETDLTDDNRILIQRVQGSTTPEKLQNAWLSLQSLVNCVVDSEPRMQTLRNKIGLGIKQIIEKKEGLFRMNMMGKRVNYAARSVICPDPFISIEEIGIPEVFAKKLTFPQSVTPFNVVELRRAVINGPNVHPGATYVKNSDGTLISLAGNETHRQGIAKLLLTPATGLSKNLQVPKEVYRHLVDGDMLLVNRQPTLHKPSIMAHKAKILKGEKTLRLHYSNCKTYNADFDGDEMNVHFPQSELARAEAQMIANVNSQYLVPKDGTPLGGLIQDHMVAGVHMTMRGTFFNRAKYQKLVFKALHSVPGPIQILPPAIIVPEKLWTGKQIISTILINLIPKEKSKISLIGSAKIAAKSWQTRPERDSWRYYKAKLKDPEMTESEVIIRDGELLCGVLDKSHYGPTPYGLIHCCYELYGGAVSSTILSALGRLFNGYIQMRGFSLHALDVVVQTPLDQKRQEIIRDASKLGYEVAAEALGLQETTDPETIVKEVEDAFFSTSDKAMLTLDHCMKSKTDNINNIVNQILMPGGLVQRFPYNNLQMMVLSGAKGTTVNTMQISCLLGQIDLEGRRPPLMPNGRSLPSFKPFDLSPRAGGFVGTGFVSGLRPQEYFFHCMAGREGLTDTAVKTSRSGYLQRCLIKHLEGIKVNYDATVRDSDGSVIQFLYGEDGLDVQKSAFLNNKQLDFLVENHAAVMDDDEEVKKISQFSAGEEFEKNKKTVDKWVKKHEFSPREVHKKTPFLKYSAKLSGTNRVELTDMWQHLAKHKKEKYKIKSTPDPVISKYRPDVQVGSIAEKLVTISEKFLSSNRAKFVLSDDPEKKRSKKQKKNQESPKKMTEDEFRQMIHLKSMRSVCQPGEAVGLLAAQSIGEPSTQMTLNTFHFAGRGEMNVTLGIPRMTEILMTASANIATPRMELPVLESALDKTQELKLQFTRLTLDQVLQSIHITEEIKTLNKQRNLMCKLRFNFLPRKIYKSKFFTTPKEIVIGVETVFLKMFFHLMGRKAKSLVTIGTLKAESSKEKENDFDLDEVTAEVYNSDKNNDSSDEEMGADDDATEARLKSRRNQDFGYDEDNEMEEEKDEDEDFEMEVEKNGEEENVDDENLSEEDNVLDENLYEEENKPLTKNEDDVKKRITAVKNLYRRIQNYEFDVKKHRWCEITLDVSLDYRKLSIPSIAKEAAKMTVLNQVPDIKHAIVTEDNGQTIIKTDGVNISHMFNFGHLLDLNRLYSNNVHAIAKTYGIEAANRVIVKEIREVFKVYGIGVDPRHLSLIADYMTFDGTYQPLNRLGIRSSTSPLQQMTFETTLQFLKTATLSCSTDRLNSPSAQLAVGNNVAVGTGSFELRAKLC